MKKLFLLFCCVTIFFTGCGETASTTDSGETASTTDSSQTDNGEGQVASSSEMTDVKDVVDDSMEPVYADALLDGSYEVSVDSSSSMFQITQCTLNVSNGEMEADMTMGGTGYLYVYLGSGEEAVAALEQDYIPYQEIEGSHHFVIPVEALDKGIACCAYSKRKQKWYDRTLVVRADSLPAAAYKESPIKSVADLSLEDGNYEIEVTLQGGSGRASVESPAQLTIKEQKATAHIVWSSSNYDYMIVNDKKYEPVNEDGNSAFNIPVDGFDYEMSVIADTTAMSTPHEIQYTLNFDSTSISPLETSASKDTIAWSELKATGSMDLSYATQFSVTNYQKGYAQIQVQDGRSYLLIPEHESVPEGIPSDITIIKKPLKNIYLAASSAMDLFDSLDALSYIAMTSTKAEDWSLPGIRQAVLDDEISYVGKYNAPDYEYLIAKNCPLAIESTMIYHNPQTKEKLESLDIPVFIERSSYEPHPLGRLEWIRVYGLFCNLEQEADEFFQEKIQMLKNMEQAEPTGKTVAFFYLTSQGMANVRKPGDYISKMLSLAGGTYILNAKDLNIEDNSLSTMNLQMETFYALARDADILIYNSTIEGELDNLSQLIDKEPLFSDFKAVKNGNVFCAKANMFQQTSNVTEMIQDFYSILHDESTDSLTYLKPLVS